MAQKQTEILEIILGIKVDHKRKSTLQLALNSARFFCGYNGGNYSLRDFNVRQGIVDKIVTGCDLNLNSDEGDLFSSLYLYLNCIEQIGNLFYEDIQIKGIRRAIEYLLPNTLSHDEIVAIRVLRNALAHQMGLMGSTFEKGQKHYFKFTLSFSEPNHNQILKLPSIPWNGDYKNKREETRTLLYVFPFIRMAETIVNNARMSFQENCLSCPLTFEELGTTYTILIDDSI